MTKSLDGDMVPTIVLPPFPKGWVKGSCLPFFESFQIPFAYHHSQGVTPTKEFVNTVTNQYLCIYWWDLPVDEEPTSVPEPPHLEVLTVERKALKAAKIVQFTMVCLFVICLEDEPILTLRSRASTIGSTIDGSTPNLDLLPC